MPLLNHLVRSYAKKVRPMRLRRPPEDLVFLYLLGALGLITNHIPFVLQTRSHKGATDGPKVHLLTCLGKSWALWEGGKMTLLFVGMYVGHILTVSVCDSKRSPFRS